MNNVEKTKEPYEAPVVLDIDPVTVNGNAGTSQGNGEPENANDYES